MKRFLSALALIAALFAPAFSGAATDKPLVIKSGQVQQIPSTDTLILPAATTANASINLPHGTAPTSPNNGDCWTATTGLFCRINSVTVGPYVSATTAALTSAHIFVGNGSNVATDVALSGDATLANTGALTIANNAVTVGKIAQAAGYTYIGNSTGSLANVADNTWPACNGITQALISSVAGGLSCQSPIPATSANPFAIGPADVGSGDGVTGLNCTSITSLPEGSLCMRTDVSGLYRMWLPNTLVPTRVQEKTAAATYAVTLGTTPVPGDFLIAACWRYGSLPAANTGWFSKATHNSGGADDSYIRVVTKLVSVSDTTSQTPCTGTDTNSYSVAVIEVSGLDMVNFNNSLATAVTFANVTGTGAITATITYTTTEVNNLGVAMFGMTTANPNNAVNQSFNAGWTHVDAPNGSNALTRGSSSAVASQTFASSATGVTASGTGGSSTFSAEGLTEVLIMLKQPTGPNVGMQQMSDLTTVYSGGVQINPSGTSARSLNFSTGLTATDDGNGAETVTSTPTFTQDCTNSGFVLTCLKTNNVSFGTFATQNYATPPAIGGTTPAAGSFTTLSATGNLTTNVTGVAANCLRANSSGVISGAGADCATGGSGTVTSVTCPGAVITTSGVCLNTITPQGRLTLVTGVPVMTSDQTAKATLYYDCYAGKLVPYYDGTNDLADSIGSCEVSTAMQASSTGVLNSGGVFDVFWDHGHTGICVATNGSGGGWASDTGGSNTARGSGYSAVHNTRGYYTNTGTVSHCYNGATDWGSFSADRISYLGTIYTTAAGQTGMAMSPAAAAGGASPVLGVWNAYNRVVITSRNQDNTASWTISSTTWRGADNSASNRVSWVDGLAQTNMVASYSIITTATSGGVIGLACDSTTAAGNVAAQSAGGNVVDALSVTDRCIASAGLHYSQAMEVSAAANTTTFYGSETSPARQHMSLIAFGEF